MQNIVSCITYNGTQNVIHGTHLYAQSSITPDSTPFITCLSALRFAS